MTIRLPINSDSLKEIFPDVYKDFFSKCSVVCSAPRTISLTGEHWENIGGGFEIRQVIPLRTYVGITASSDKIIRLVRYISFDSLQNKFYERNREGLEGQKELIEKNLYQFIESELKIKLPYGFNIHVLSELPLELSYGGMRGSFIVALLVSMFLYLRFITVRNLEGWKSATTQTLQNNDALLFNRVFLSIWKWESQMGYITGGLQPFASLLPSHTPIFFASFKNPLIDKAKNLYKEPYWYWGARTEEICASHQGWPLQCDWGVISIKETQMSRASVSLFEDVKRHSRTVVGKTIEMLRKFGISPAARTSLVNNVFPMLKNPEEAWRYINGGKSIFDWEACILLKELIENGYSEQRMRALAETLNKAQSFFLPMGLTTSAIDKIIGIFREHVSKYTDTQLFGIRMRALATRNSVFFIAPGGSIRPAIEGLLKKLNKEKHKGVTLDYASWIDGYEKEGGVKVEQFFEEGVYSKFIRFDAVRITHLNTRGKTVSQIIDASKVHIEIHDLFLDMINGKIYIKGKGCTSKELPSQKMAIELFSLLLESSDSRVHNQDLTRSSYSTYRNELQGKITGPLRKLIKERLGKNLDIKIQGKLTDFWIYFKPKGLDIAVIKKLNPKG